jgi:hypothetical protein
MSPQTKGHTMTAPFSTSATFCPPDVIQTAGAFVSRDWGEYGYSIAPAMRSGAVYVFEVAHYDGSRFNIAVDRWCNVRALSDDLATAEDQVRAMHYTAVAP